jgi:hypothetical protein
MRLKITTIFNYRFDSTKKADKNSDLVQFRFVRDRIYVLLPARSMRDHKADSLFQEFWEWYCFLKEDELAHPERPFRQTSASWFISNTGNRSEDLFYDTVSSDNTLTLCGTVHMCFARRCQHLISSVSCLSAVITTHKKKKGKAIPVTGHGGP